MIDPISHTFTLGKDERLKSRKLIDRVFREGQRIALFPFRIFYCISTSPLQYPTGLSVPTTAQSTTEEVTPAAKGTPHLQAGFGAGSRNFKKAVDRNRIKRLTREAYRLQKQGLDDHLAGQGLFMAVFFIYTGRDLPDYTTVKEKIGVALQKLVKATAS